MHRSFAYLAAGVVALAATACGGAAPTPSPSQKAPPASAAASAAPSASAPASPSAPPASAAAKPASAKPAASGPIKVGLMESLTGAFAQLSKDNQDGFNLYLESINSTAAGRKIEIVNADDSAKSDVGLTKAKQLVESDKVQLIMGVQFSVVCQALAQYAKEAQVPVVITGNCPNQTLFTDPKLKSPYLMRFTWFGSETEDVVADYAYKTGFRKAIIMGNESVGGLELADSFASAFVKRGGAIVQEFYPAVGTPDFGPFLAQLNQQADMIITLQIGVDALRFGQQFAGYTGPKKPQMMSQTGGTTSAFNMAQLKDQAVGLIGVDSYCECLDTPLSQSFLKAWRAKYPGRLVSGDVVHGYAGAQILEAAIKKVNGNVEDKQAFLNALYATNLDTVKGPIKLDQDHDVIQNQYVFKVVKQGDSYGYQLLETYKELAATWDRTPQELVNLPFGKLRGKWVGMTKDKLELLIANPQSA